MQLLSLTPTEFNQFTSRRQRAQFLQSTEWAQFQSVRGNYTEIIGVKHNDQIIAATLIIKFALFSFPRFYIMKRASSEAFLSSETLVKEEAKEGPLFKNTNYLYCPRGPIFDDKLSPEELTSAAELIWQYLQTLGQKHKSILTKIEPPILLDSPQAQVLSKSFPPKTKPGFFKQPADTWCLELTPDTNELLAQMHPKHRYNINLATKKGVTITSGRTTEDIAAFNTLIRKTYDRKHIHTYPEEYYEKIITSSAENPTDHNSLSALIYLANFEGKPIAGNLITFFGDTVTYLHGGTDGEYRNLMAPQLLQWQTIQDAKNLGYKYYDFYGVVPEKQFTKQDQILRTGHLFGENHPGNGYTRFKHGFGGQEVNLLGTFEIVYKPMIYFLYTLYKKLRRGL